MFLVRIMGIVVLGAEGESQISTLDKIMILMTMFIAVVVTFK